MLEKLKMASKNLFQRPAIHSFFGNDNHSDSDDSNPTLIGDCANSDILLDIENDYKNSVGDVNCDRISEASSPISTVLELSDNESVASEADSNQAAVQNIWDDVWETPTSEIKPDPIPMSKRKSKEPWHLRNQERPSQIILDGSNPSIDVSSKPAPLVLSKVVLTQRKGPSGETEWLAREKFLDEMTESERKAVLLKAEANSPKKERKRKPKIDYVNGGVLIGGCDEEELKDKKRKNLQKTKSVNSLTTAKPDAKPTFSKTRNKFQKSLSVEPEQQVLTPAMVFLQQQKGSENVPFDPVPILPPLKLKTTAEIQAELDATKPKDKKSLTRYTSTPNIAQKNTNDESKNESKKGDYKQKKNRRRIPSLHGSDDEIEPKKPVKNTSHNISKMEENKKKKKNARSMRRVKSDLVGGSTVGFHNSSKTNEQRKVSTNNNSKSRLKLSERELSRRNEEMSKRSNEHFSNSSRVANRKPESPVKNNTRNTSKKVCYRSFLEQSLVQLYHLNECVSIDTTDTHFVSAIYRILSPSFVDRIFVKTTEYWHNVDSELKDKSETCFRPVFPSSPIECLFGHDVDWDKLGNVVFKDANKGYFCRITGKSDVPNVHGQLRRYCSTRNKTFNPADLPSLVQKCYPRHDIKTGHRTTSTMPPVLPLKGSPLRYDTWNLSKTFKNELDPYAPKIVDKETRLKTQHIARQHADCDWNGFWDHLNAEVQIDSNVEPIIQKPFKDDELHQKLQAPREAGLMSKNQKYTRHRLYEKFSTKNQNVSDKKVIDD